MSNPKHFVIQLGALIALYVAITSLVVLVFSTINLKFPDAAEMLYQTESARDAIRVSMAFLIVFFPTYLVLTRVSNQQRRQATGGQYTLLAKWLIYLSLLVGGGVLLGDLVALIMFFLEGEITTRFLLKVAALFVIVGAAFHYYLLDIRGYFTNRVDKALYFGVGAVVLVIFAVTYSYNFIETPAEVREARIDDNQIGHLQDMQWRIEDYYRTNEALPETIEVLYREVELPAAPEGREPYQYKVVDDTRYELCATFAQDSAQSDYTYARPITAKNDNWSHGEGEWCFERVIDKQYRQ